MFKIMFTQSMTQKVAIKYMNTYYITRTIPLYLTDIRFWKLANQKHSEPVNQKVWVMAYAFQVIRKLANQKHSVPVNQKNPRSWKMLFSQSGKQPMRNILCLSIDDVKTLQIFLWGFITKDKLVLWVLMSSLHKF